MGKKKPVTKRTTGTQPSMQNHSVPSEARTEHQQREASRDLTKRILMDPTTTLWGIHKDDTELDPRLNCNFLDLVHPRKHWLVLIDFPELRKEPPPKTIEPEAPTPRKERTVQTTANVDAKKTTTKARFQLFGYSMGEILRWMGINNWPIDKATKALAEMGCYPAADTIRWQLTAGKKGGYGDPAPLTKSEQNRLKAASED